MFRTVDDQQDPYPRARWRVVGDRVRVGEGQSQAGTVVDIEVYLGMDGRQYCRYFIRWDDDALVESLLRSPNGYLYTYVCSNTSPGVVDE